MTNEKGYEFMDTDRQKHSWLLQELMERSM